MFTAADAVYRLLGSDLVSNGDVLADVTITVAKALLVAKCRTLSARGYFSSPLFGRNPNL